MHKIEIVRYNPKVNKDFLRQFFINFEEEVELKRNIKSNDLKRINNSIDQLFSNLESEKDLGYTPMWNNYPLGFLICHPYSNNASEIIKPGDIEFLKAYLHPKVRGRNIGYAMNNEAINDIKSLKNDGLNYKRIISTIEQTQVENIYLKTKKLGFRELANSMYIEPKTNRVYSTYVKSLR